MEQGEEYRRGACEGLRVEDRRIVKCNGEERRGATWRAEAMREWGGEERRGGRRIRKERTGECWRRGLERRGEERCGEEQRGADREGRRRRGEKNERS